MVPKSPYSDAKLSRCSWCSLILLVRAEQIESPKVWFIHTYSVRDFHKRSRNLNVKYAKYTLVLQLNIIAIHN